MNLITKEKEWDLSEYNVEVLCASWNPTVEAVAEYIQDAIETGGDESILPVDEAAFLNRIYAAQE
jgi:hypothetical protein